MRMTCEAAGRAGSGLVTAGVPHSLGDIAAVTLLEAMSRLLPDTPQAHDRGVCSGTQRWNLQRTRMPLSWVRAFRPIPKRRPLSAPLSRDASRRWSSTRTGSTTTWRAISSKNQLDQRSPCATILTPHPGEMARLAGVDTRAVQDNRVDAAKSFAAAHQAIVVLKGHDTVIAHPDGTVAINATGNNGMATGGTGDVLAGLLGGLLAQGMTAWDAARLGVWLHGYAGDCAAEQFTSRAMLARDV